MYGFSQWLDDELGLEPKSVSTYLRAVRQAVGEHPQEPWKILESRKLTKNSKVVYRAALKRWAEYTEDKALQDLLESRKIRKLLSVRGQKPPKKVLGLEPEEVDAFMVQLEEYRNEEAGEGTIRVVAEPWIWPCLSLTVKLALRAQVDLTWITREAAQEALRNGRTLTLVSKGRKERGIPCSHALAELEALEREPEWSIVGELISPAATKVNEAAYEKVRRWMKRVAQESGLDPKLVHTHRFRHAAARWLLTKAVDQNHTDPVGLVQQLLGHSSRRTTEIYLQADMNQDIADLLSQRVC